MTLDLVIAGGGIAGCLAALRAAQLGLSSMLIAGGSGERERPPEQVPERIEKLFAAFHADQLLGQAVVSRTSAMEVTGGSEPDGPRPWVTLNIDRNRLDAALLKLAAARDVQVALGDSAAAVVREGGRVGGIQTAKGMRVTSRWTIDASGHARWLSRSLRSRNMLLSPQLFAWREAVCALDVPRPGSGIFTPGEDGWTLLVAERDRPVRTRMLSGDSLRARTRNGAEREEFQGARDVTWRVTRPLAGPGYFIAGEAGGQIDPACGQGVYMAALSGIRAVESAFCCLRDPSLAGAHLACYDTWFIEQLMGIAQTLREMYRNLSIRVFDSYDERGYESA
jgi:flavin-dependent dehydrogenase